MKSAKDIQDVIFLEGSFYIGKPFDKYNYDEFEDLEKSEYLIKYKFSEYYISSEYDPFSEFCEIFNIQDTCYSLPEIYEFLDNYEFRDQVTIYTRLKLSITF